MATTEISTLCEWSAPKRVRTAKGERDLRTASPTGQFWDTWRSAKDSLKAAGISVGKSEKTGQWEVCWWQPISAIEVAAKVEAREASAAATSDLAVPAPDGLEYLPFQRAGVAYALARPATLIADQMGLGKTIQAIGLINADPSISKVCVVCPASLKINWSRELTKWLARPLSVGIADGKNLPATDIVVVNYDVLRKHAESLNARGLDLVCLDEAHYAKNPKAARTKAVVGLKARRKLALTGTPILNRPIEIQPILAWLCPDKSSFTFWPFARRYAAAHRSRFGWDFTGASNMAELQGLLRETVMVRRLKEDVLTELPAKRRQVIELPSNGHAAVVNRELSAWEAREATLADLRVRVELAKCSDDPADYEAALAALGAGARAAFTEISKLRHETALAKVPLVAEHIRDVLEVNGKVVVFAHHRDVIQQLRDALSDFGAVSLTGEDDQQTRQVAVDRFQSDDTCRVFVGSTQAAGVGLTLTASSHVIFAELDWVPANLTQAEDRCHRIGQTQSVLVQHLVLERSLDAAMAAKIVAKQAVIDRALDADLAELKADPVLPTSIATADLTRAQIEREAVEADWPAERRANVHANLRRLAAMCDGAEALDGSGYNKYDAPLGHALAALPSLTVRQAILGDRMTAKYRRQLGN